MDPDRNLSRARARRRAASAALVGALALVAAAVAVPVPIAGAQTVNPGPGSQRGWHAGRKIVFPTHEAWHNAGHPDPGEAGNPLPRRAARASGSGPLHYGGAVDGIGVTTGAPKVYVVFWGSQWLSGGDPMGMAPRLQAMFQGIGTNNETWSGVMTQYCQGVGAGLHVVPGERGARRVPDRRHAGRRVDRLDDRRAIERDGPPDRRRSGERGRALREHHCVVEPQRAVLRGVADRYASGWLRPDRELLCVARLERRHDAERRCRDVALR